MVHKKERGKGGGESRLASRRFGRYGGKTSLPSPDRPEGVCGSTRFLLFSIFVLGGWVAQRVGRGEVGTTGYGIC